MNWDTPSMINRAIKMVAIYRDFKLGLYTEIGDENERSQRRKDTGGNMGTGWKRE